MFSGNIIPFFLALGHHKSLYEDYVLKERKRNCVEYEIGCMKPLFLNDENRTIRQPNRMFRASE